MEDRSAIYNNAGVRVILANVGNHVAALELFGGALEAKRTTEMTHGAPQPQDSTTRPPPLDCVRRAEVHLQSLSSYLTSTSTSSQQALSVGELHEILHQHGSSINAGSDMITVPLSSRGYDPYLYKIPFRISDDQQESPLLSSSAIVFNMGLVHQMISRTGQKTADFYAIAASILSIPPLLSDTLLIRIALLNNLGVWCFENGEGGSMRTCMEQLSIVTSEEEAEASALDAGVLAGVRSNIQWLLNPLNGGSPAA
jgi:hypothetical protein